MGTGHPQASVAGSKPMAEQEPLRASVPVVVSVPKKELWPKDKPGAPVAVDRAMLRCPMEHQCPCMGLCWSTPEPWPWINPWQSSYSLGGTAAVGKATSTSSVWAENFLPCNLYKIMFVKI